MASCEGATASAGESMSQHLETMGPEDDAADGGAGEAAHDQPSEDGRPPFRASLRVRRRRRRRAFALVALIVVVASGISFARLNSAIYATPEQSASTAGTPDAAEAGDPAPAVPGKLNVERAPSAVAAEGAIDRPDGDAAVGSPGDQEGAPPPEVANAPEAEEAALEPLQASPDDDGGAGNAAVTPAAGEGVIASDVNMRTGPDRTASVLAVLRAGTPVVILSCDYWCEVEADGQRGWVYRDFVNAGR